MEPIREKATAWRYLADMCYSGEGTDKNYSKVKQFYKQVIAQSDSKEIDKAKALGVIGLLYHYGKSVTKNETTANAYLKRAFDIFVIMEKEARFTSREKTSAKCLIGQEYYFGLSITKNYTRAKLILNKY